MANFKDNWKQLWLKKKSCEILFVLTKKNSSTIVHIVLFHLYLPKWDVSPQAKGKCFNLMCVLSIKTRENFDRWIKDRECCLKKKFLGLSQKKNTFIISLILHHCNAQIASYYLSQIKFEITKIPWNQFFNRKYCVRYWTLISRNFFQPKVNFCTAHCGKTRNSLSPKFFFVKSTL